VCLKKYNVLGKAVEVTVNYTLKKDAVLVPVMGSVFGLVL
jgi:hypothetical protein